MIDQPFALGLGAYTPTNAAIYAGVSLRRVQIATKDEELEASYPDTEPRYTQQQLDDWIADWPKTKPKPRKRV